MYIYNIKERVLFPNLYLSCMQYEVINTKAYASRIKGAERGMERDGGKLYAY